MCVSAMMETRTRRRQTADECSHLAHSHQFDAEGRRLLLLLLLHLLSIFEKSAF